MGRAAAVAGLALILAAGCRTAGPPTPRSPLPAEEEPAAPPPPGRVLHSDPALGYAIVEFDGPARTGVRLRLVDGEGVTGTVRVSARRSGALAVVEILDGRPAQGDQVGHRVEDRDADE